MTIPLDKFEADVDQLVDNDIIDYYANKTTTFFMYSEEDNEHLADYNRCLEKPDRAAQVRTYSMFKEGGEVHFLRQLRNSSWRVRDKDSAALVVIPILFGFEGCWGERKKFLNNITMDKRHIVMSTFYTVGYNSVCRSCIHMKAVLFNKAGTACQLVAPMNSQLHRENLGRFTSDISSKLIDWNERRYAFYFGGQADSRVAYTSRRRVLASFSRIRDNVTLGDIEQHVWSKGGVKGDPDYLQRMLNTKIGIHIAGDTLNSNRLFEWMEVDAFPVILADGFYEKAAPGLNIPWREFTEQIFGKLTGNPELLDSRLVEISNIPSEMIRRKMKIMRKFKKRLLWNHTDSRVAETLLIDAMDKCILGQQYTNS